MYAIAFDLEVAVLKTEYGDPYNNAYFEIRKELATLDFDWTQGSVYLHTGRGLGRCLSGDQQTIQYPMVQEVSPRHSSIQGRGLV